jgi:hypothetical protein
VRAYPVRGKVFMQMALTKSPECHVSVGDELRFIARNTGCKKYNPGLSKDGAAMKIEGEEEPLCS